VTVPVVMIVGRVGPEEVGFRGGSYRAGERYLHAVSRAGGATVIAPPIAEAIDQTLSLLTRVDALLLHGGGDVDPARYGQAAGADELYGIVGVHDEVELAVCREAIARDLPVLAICRGMQVLNVALGGTLHQHIGDDHRMRHHDVDVVAGSRLADTVGEARLTAAHCVHHQAIDRLGGGLGVTASTADGVIHAIEHDEASWVIGVQWHPEDTAASDARQQSLFDELTRRARRPIAG
jgi:putative glutamine amidotransferase